MLFLLICAVIAVPVLFYAFFVGRNWWFLDPINTFWPPYILFGVLQPWVFREEWVSIYGRETVLRTLAIYILVGICVCFGYRLSIGRMLAAELPAFRGRDDNRALIILGFTALIIGFAGYAYVIAVSGGFQEFLSTSRTNINYSKVNGYILNLLAAVPFGLLVLLCTSYLMPRYVFLKKLAFAATLAYGGWAVYTGTRSGVITTAIVVIGAVYGPKRRNPSLAVAVLAFVAVFVLVGFTTRYRGAFYGGSFHSDDTLSEALELSLNSYTQLEAGSAPLGAEFGMSAAVVEYVPGAVAYDRGHMLLELFTRPVPRSWWPDKIYPEGEAWDRIHRVAGTAGWVNEAGYLSGPAPGFVGKWYYLGGIFGVVLGSLWTGVFLQSIREYVSRYVGVARVIMAVGCAQLGFSEMNNPLLWPIAWLPATGVSMLIVVILSRERTSPVSKSPKAFLAPLFHPRMRRGHWWTAEGRRHEIGREDGAYLGVPRNDVAFRSKGR